MSEQDRLKVHIKFGDFENDIEGNPEEVAEEFNRVVTKLIPTFDIARKIVLNYSLNDLISRFGDFIKITPEGPRVITEKRLSDKVMIALQLVAVKVGAESGRKTSHRVTLPELERATGLNPKSISSRLSELVKAGYVERVVVDDGTYYFITTMGVEWLSRQVSRS
ncbi:MAG: hypothetical protein QXG05_06365 [Nitrososphaerota archaeon]